MRFAQKSLKCMNCKTSLPPDRTTLCIHCESKEAELYGRTMLQVCAWTPVLNLRHQAPCRSISCSDHHSVAYR